MFNHVVLVPILVVIVCTLFVESADSVTHSSFNRETDLLSE